MNKANCPLLYSFLFHSRLLLKYSINRISFYLSQTYYPEHPIMTSTITTFAWPYNPLQLFLSSSLEPRPLLSTSFPIMLLESTVINPSALYLKSSMLYT